MLACCEYAFCRSRSIVVRLTSVTLGTGAGRMFGNAGAPACAGESETAVCWRFVRSVVLPADSSALATARSGTRSKYSPAPPRTIVLRDPGAQAKPTRGETLFR